MANKRETFRRWRRRILIAGALAPAMALMAILAFHTAVALMAYPSDTVAPIQQCAWIEDRAGDCLGAFASPSGQWNLPLAEDQISPHLLKAIVAIEDRRFYEHHGVDWQSVANAAVEDVLFHHQRRGASTITMQLYRLGHSASRSIMAKLIQAIRAEQIEQRLGKQTILTDYLNAAPFGGNLVGAGAASWRYFGRPCKELSLAEAALLAGLPQNPNGFRPDRFPDRARIRRNRVLDDMLALKMIDAKQHDQAIAEPINAKWLPLPQENDLPCPAVAENKNPLGILPLMTELANENPGRMIRTTIDRSVQRQVAAEAADALAHLAPSHISAAAIVVLNTRTAECLASVSLSSSRAGDAIDLTNRPRSSGSTLKPFIYAAAFDAGICTPQSIVNDSPTVWAGYAPQDYDRDFAGPMLAADALAQSRNIPAMVILSKVGIDRAIQTMSTMGLTTLARQPTQYGLPLAIGGADITPMELAEAYATLARGGKPRRATVLLNSPLPSIQLHSTLRLESCRAALYCIADPDRTERICPSAAALSPAWKTGTSSGHRDAWCAAVTPRRTVVVWLGNAYGSGSDALVGQDAAAPLALKILAATDPGGEGFAPPPTFHADAQTASAIELSPDSSAPPTMISPINGQEIVRDPSLPLNQQRLALRAADPQSGQLWWFIDDQFAGQSPSSQPLWWTPTRGQHEIRAISKTGQAIRVQIRVR